MCSLRRVHINKKALLSTGFPSEYSNVFDSNPVVSLCYVCPTGEYTGVQRLLVHIITKCGVNIIAGIGISNQKTH